jgi:uncharacterized protein YbaP (TraB family)
MDLQLLNCVTAFERTIKMLMHRAYKCVVFFLLALLCFQINARAAANPFLWEIEGERPSYLYGTIHFPDPRVTTLPNSVETAFRNSQVVYTEIPLDKATLVAQVSKLTLPADQTLLEIVPAELIARTEKYMQGISPGLTIEPFTRFKVWALALSLSSLEQQVKNPGKLALDAQLFQRAQHQGKKVAGLETLEEQIAIFDNLNQQEQIKMLRDTLDFIDAAKEKGVNIPEQFIAWYKKGDIDAFGKLLMQYVKKDKFYDTFLQKVIYNRNKLMADRILKIIQTHPNQSHFFAIGAGHFWGKSSIQNYLIKQGLKISRWGTTKARPHAGDKVDMAIEENQKKLQTWYEKGILFTVYGNDKAAIPHFQKVIEINPRHSDAYFQMGVSYGQLGDYQKAISAIDKAIELNAEKDVYYYGRGRVYLMSGKKESALNDFKQAAAMGNRDAKNYLEKYAIVQ